MPWHQRSRQGSCPAPGSAGPPTHSHAPKQSTWQLQQQRALVFSLIGFYRSTRQQQRALVMYSDSFFCIMSSSPPPHKCPPPHTHTDHKPQNCSPTLHLLPPQLVQPVLQVLDVGKVEGRINAEHEDPGDLLRIVVLLDVPAAGIVQQAGKWRIIRSGEYGTPNGLSQPRMELAEAINIPIWAGICCWCQDVILICSY